MRTFGTTGDDIFDADTAPFFAGKIGQVDFIITTDNINGKDLGYYNAAVWISDLCVLVSVVFVVICISLINPEHPLSHALLKVPLQERGKYAPHAGSGTLGTVTTFTTAQQPNTENRSPNTGFSHATKFPTFTSKKRPRNFKPETLKLKLKQWTRKRSPP